MGYSRIDPAAFSNAFDRQRVLGAQGRAADQAEEMNALQIGAMQRQEDEAKAPKYDPQAFQRVGGIAAQISTLGDPTQKRAAFKQAILGNGAAFDALGMPHTEALAKLDTLDDAGLDATLTALAQHAPQAAPTDVAPGHVLARPDGKGGYSAAYTAPSAPGEAADPFAKINPSDYTQASLAKFETSGKRSDLVARDKPVDPNEQAKIAAVLRDDFRNDSKVFQGVADAYQRVTDSSADPTGAGDVALLYNYLKVLDPASTVREGEFQTVGSSGGLPTQVQGFFSKMVNGKLPDELRSDIVNRATRLYRGQESRFKTQVLDRYQGLAKRYGVDPSEFSDPRAKVPTSSLPPTNAQGWTLHTDAQGNRAYVSPDGKQFDEVQ